MNPSFLGLCGAALALALFTPAEALAATASKVHFEPNQGQALGPVQFASRGAKERLLVTSDAIWLRASGQPLVKLTLIGAQPFVARGEDALPSVSHYQVGSDGARWRAGVPHYAKVRIPDVYPGIHWVAYGNEDSLEYDFVIAPGANPADIRMGFEGADAVWVDEQGALRVRSAAGEIRQRAPIAYQDSGGGRSLVTAKYRVQRGNVVSLIVGEYDKSKTLVIDPILSSTWRVGAGGTEFITDIVVDASGNVFSTGYTDGNGFPTTSGAAQTSFRGDVDAFVRKVSPSGTLLYSTFFGGDAQDNATAIALDGAGRAYIVGETSSSNLPVVRGFGGVSGKKRAFVSVLAADGRSVAYSSYLGGTGAGDKLNARDVAVTSSGEFWIVGDTTVPHGSFPPGFSINGFQRTLDPENAEEASDAFVLRGNPSLTGTASITYFSYYGGRGHDVARKMARRPSGAFIVAGDSDSSNLRINNNLTAPGGSRDVFLLQASGANFFEGSVLLGGDQDERAGGVAIDTSGNIYVAGETHSQNLPASTHASQKAHADTDPQLFTDGFVAKTNANATSLSYLTYLGGVGTERVNDLAVTRSGHAIVVGSTYSRSFPTSPSAIQGSSNGPRDGYLARLGATGARVYSSYFGGSAVDDALSVGLSGQVTWVGGASESSSFPGASSRLGDYDGILMKLTASVLFVVGNTSLTAGDTAIRNRLTGTLGFNVTTKSAASATSGDANGKDLIVVSSSVTSGDVNTKFKNSPVGILNLEDAIQDDLGMTGTQSTEYGRTGGQTQITMLSSTDPISAGLSGNQAVTTTGKNFNWGRPNANAVKVATLLGDATRSTIYRYEAGSTLFGAVKAVERRTGFFLWEDTASALTGNGWSLFDAAARWTAGR